jgi:hypothetical protein
MRAAWLIARETVCGSVRGGVLPVVLFIGGLAVAGAVLVIANVPASLMEAAATLVEEGRMPASVMDTGGAEREEQARALLGLDEGDYAIVMRDTARDAAFRYVIGTGGAVLALLVGLMVNDTRSERAEVMIARPVRRRDVVLGQVAGALVIVTAAVAWMTAVLYLLHFAQSREASGGVFVASALILPNLWAVAALAYALATVWHVLAAGPAAGLLCLAASQVAPLHGALVARGHGGGLTSALGVAGAVLPRFSQLRQAAEALLFGDAAPPGLGAAVVVSALNVCVLAALAAALLSRRDL